MSKDNLRALDDSELDKVSGGADLDVNQLAEAREQIGYASCSHCQAIGTGWQCYASQHNGVSGMVCVCSNCNGYFIVMPDGSTYDSHP